MNVVSTASGALSGSVDAVTAFKGVPFAAPPVGPLRWQPPVATSRTGTRDATQFGDDPMQVVNPAHESCAPGTSEDCLTLNIWAPRDGAPGSCPVMVWIDGGAFVTASGAKHSLDGSAFAARGVVLVTINYRVGVFGYLAHPELTRESPHAASGNYGLLDQIAALRWVRENIAAFGGTPECVTIFRISAGGASVAALLISPLARGMFQRAILQSPAPARATIISRSPKASRPHPAGAGASSTSYRRSSGTGRRYPMSRRLSVSCRPTRAGASSPRASASTTNSRALGLTAHSSPPRESACFINTFPISFRCN